MNSEAVATVYGTSWCPDCWRAKKILDGRGVPYLWVDIDKNADAAERVRSLNHGMRSVPTIVFANGTVLVEPSNAQLLQAITSL